ncbi:MAG TPA: hypothetical protein EYG05_06115 [Candidatus Thioglobus autotrophicus]|nr:hypothetical protein [Candidatus Thioglobus autotrophicus]
MHIALDRTLILLIEHKELMFGFIDYMDQNQRKDIPEQVFTNSMIAKLTAMVKKNEAERLKDAFDRNNLIKSGIISEFNKSRGTIAFQPAVIEIFRLFDKERVRGLRSAELENIRVQLGNALQQHQDLSFSTDNEAFFEQRDHLFDLLRQINSQIQNNTEHLEHEADRLSKRLDHNQAVLTLDESQQVREVLLQVKKIYDREIIPTLEFLNTREYSKVKAPLTLIDDISRLYDLRGFEDDSYYIDQYKLSILSHYKAVEKVRQTLQRYLHQERRHRLTYNAIEKAYLDLQVLAESTFTENLKERYIFKSLAQRDLYFKGLKTYSSAQETKIEWHERNHSLYFNEYLIEQNARQRSEAVAEVVSFDNKQNPDPNNVLKRQIRVLIEQCDIKPPVADLYAELHNLLVDNLSENYQLQYLLYGVSCYKHRIKKTTHLKVSFEYPQQKIHYKNKVLEYNKRVLNE